MLTLDHLGVVVSDIDTGSAHILATLPVVECTDRFDDETLGVSVKFYRDAGGLVFELIAPFGDRSPVLKTLKQNHRLNQLAYICPNIAEAGAALRQARAVPLGPPKPALAFSGSPVQFFWSQLGFVIELIEAPGHRHDFRPCR